MDVKGIKIQADLYCLFKEIVATRPQFYGTTFSGLELEYLVRPSKKRIDLLVLEEENGVDKPFLVIETKKSKIEKDTNDYDSPVYFTNIGRTYSLREALGKGLLDEMSYKYYKGAMAQARGYAENVEAAFYSVCYADSMLIRSLTKKEGLYYERLIFQRDFGLQVLQQLARLHDQIRKK